MTIEGRPTVNRKTQVTREVEFTLTGEQLNDLIIPYLQKTFPEFRGFTDDEITIEWESKTEDTVTAYIYAFQEKSK